MSSMVIPTTVMAVVALALVGVGFFRGQGEHVAGLKASLNITLQTLPLLIFAFIAAGMIPALLPQEFIAKWVGAQSGARGIFIGTLAGAVAPGGPYVSLPIAAMLLRSGAGIGTMVAFLTGWSLWGVSRLPLEFGLLGWKFSLIRLACTFFFPPVAGLIASSLFSWVKT